jgi:transcription initiation factor TFIIA large subunit
VQGWQHKLSQMGVAAFPWDPKPQPTPAENPTPAPPAPAVSMVSNATYTQSTLSPPANTAPLSLPGSIPNGLPAAAPSPVVKTEPNPKNEPVIKQEPGLSTQPQLQAYHAGPQGVTSRPPMGNASELAQQRAAQNLQSKFGARADAAITSLYNAKPGPQVNPGQPQPGQPQQINAAQYRQSMAAATAAAMHQHNPQAPYSNGGNGLPTSQVDGPSEGFEGILMQRGPDGNTVEMGRVQIDEMIHAQIAARAKQMEGGGLMLPLREATKHRSIATKRSTSNDRVQVDGTGDVKDEELDVDADAINSDLDDPEDDQEDDDDDDESNNHMMLCMYDKVQRVKNKW